MRNKFKVKVKSQNRETGETLHPLAGEENLMKKKSEIKKVHRQKTKHIERHWGHSDEKGK